MATAGSRRPIVGLLIGGSLVLVACGRNTSVSQAPTALPALHPASALVVAHPLPPLDLEVAGLTRVAELVTPFQLSSTDNGRTITLIAAYADTARTVLVFRESPDTGVPNASVSDEQGLINAGGSAGPVRSPGFRGDYYVALDEGAHPGPDGLAHLTVSISDLRRWTPAGGSVDGSWVFNATLKVQPGVALPAPNQFQLGTWKVNIEKLELTPAVVQLQTLVNGASPVAVRGPGKGDFVELIDAAGNPVRDLGGGASITVPKQQVNPWTIRTPGRMTSGCGRLLGHTRSGFSAAVAATRSRSSSVLSPGSSGALGSRLDLVFCQFRAHPRDARGLKEPNQEEEAHERRSPAGSRQHHGSGREGPPAEGRPQGAPELLRPHR